MEDNGSVYDQKRVEAAIAAMCAAAEALGANILEVWQACRHLQAACEKTMAQKLQDLGEAIPEELKGR